MCVFVDGSRRPAEVLAEGRLSVYMSWALLFMRRALWFMKSGMLLMRGLVVYEGRHFVYEAGLFQ
jgi:hypothetical protein